MSLSTHILDISCGQPAGDVPVSCHKLDQGDWKEVSREKTDANGRVARFGDELAAGIYRLRFETGSYFSTRNASCFYPYVEITFEVQADQHYHVPLLISPYGYSTYRGS